MPAYVRRELLTAAQRAELLALPTDRLEIRERSSLTPADFDLINRHRTEANRLGFAIQLCLLRYPGRAWLPAEQLPSEMLRFIAGQIGAGPTALADYAQRDETRREHQQELLTAFGWKTIDRLTYRVLARWLVEIAWGVDQSVSLLRELLGELRRRRILMPSMAELERLVAACRHRARQRAYEALTCQLNEAQREALDVLLQSQDQTRQTRLGWIRESVGLPTPAQILKRLDRLRALRSIGIPSDWAREVHQNRLLQMARQAAAMNVWHLRQLEPKRRYATLVAVALDTMAMLTDQILEMHNRLIGLYFKKAERKHLEAFQEVARAINEKVNLYAQIGRALIAAREAGTDAYQAIEAVLEWDAFRLSVQEAATLGRPHDFDYLESFGAAYAQFRRYVPRFLDAFEFRASAACAELLRAVDLLRELNKTAARRVPDDAPIGFIRRRWQPYVFEAEGINRRFYELCVLSEMSNALRSGEAAPRSCQFAAMQMIIPGIPLCRNCDLCLRNSRCPRAACNACLFGDCEEDPPIT